MKDDRRWNLVVALSIVVLLAACLMLRLGPSWAGLILLLIFAFMVSYGVLGFRFK